jgi:hypothetical protein
VRRLAKAMSAGSILGTGSSRGRSDRAFATLAAVRGFNGSGAPSHRLRNLVVALVAIVAAALAVAPGAFASKVVIDSVENPMPVLDQATKGGKFSTFSVTALAVNDSGTGGAGPGDFYVVDSGNSRVQRFSASGEFKELWGVDVVETGPENGTAIQSLTVDATGGQFKLTFGGDTTPDLPYDATAAQVQTALQALGSVGAGNVLVTGGPGDAGGSVTYGIIFTGSLAGSAQSPIVASAGTTPLSGGAASAMVRTLNAGGDTGGFEICKASQACKAGGFSTLAGGFLFPYGVAVQQSTGNVFVTNKGAQRVDVFTANGIFIRAFGLDVVNTGKAGDAPAQSAKQSLTVKATGGTFKLSFQGKTTTDLAFDAGAAEVQAALQALSSVGPQGITVSGGPGDEAGSAPYVITFAGGLGDSPQPLITAASGSLSGGAASAQVASTQAGRTGLEVCVDPADCKSGVAGSVGGALNGPAGITFAPPGAPNAGNVLVTEEQKSRVSEFTPAGAFVRAFGFGVVNVGPSKTGGTASAVQRLTIAAGNGTFKLSFEGQTTAALPYDATSEEVRSALNGLSSIGGRSGSVTVTGGPGDANGSNPFTITFGGGLAGRAVGAITVDTNSLGLAVGAEASCSTAPEPPDGVTYQWLRNGVAIPGATASTYTFAPADEGKGIQCQVFARYGNVFATQMTAPYVVSPVPSTALPIAPEYISLQPSDTLDGVGDRELTCNAGSWGNAPTEYTYQFLKGGKPLGAPITTAATSQAITIGAGEQQVATAFQCVVTAKNAGGSTSIASYTTQTTPQPAPTPALPFPVGSAFSSVSSVSSGAPGFEACLAASFDTCQGGVSGTAKGQFTGPVKIAEDATGNIYTIAESFFPADFRVEYFSQSGGGTLTPQGEFAPSVVKGSEFNYRPTDVAIGPESHVFVNQMYKKDDLPPCIDVEASPEVVSHEFDASGNLVDTHLRCSNNSGGGGIFAYTGSRALAVNGVTGRLFYVTNKAAVLIADEADGPNAVVTPATEVHATSATLNAEIEPLKGPWNTYYHFETRAVGDTAWQRQPAVIPLDPVIGNGTGSGSAKSCPDGNPPKCEISFVAGGLRPSTEYEVRVMAYTWKGLTISTSTIGWTFGGYQRSDGPNFTTVPSGPTAVTGDANWSSPAATKPSLDLEGSVNAANRRTTVVFEYVTEEQFQASGWADAAVAPKAPARPAEAGQNYISIDVRQSVVGLDPTKTYRYRLAATNDSGTDYGAARTVAPPRDDARYLELISNADGEGMGAAVGFSSAFLGTSQDGKRVYFSSQSIGTPDSLSGLNTPYGADRGPDGWKVFQVGADPNRALGNFLPGDYLVSSDLSGVLWEGFDAETRERRVPSFSFTPAYGENELLTQMEPRQIAPASLTTGSMVGGSPDFDTFTFLGFTGETYLPGEMPIASGQPNGQYYQVTGARSGNPQLSLVNQDDDGVQIGGACPPQPGSGFNQGGEYTQSATVSADGDVVYFLANQGMTGTTCNFFESLNHPQRLFKRVDAEETVAVSAPTCTPTPLCGGPNGRDVYRGASLDGSVVVFKTDRRVTPSDQDFGNDVYIYDETPPAGEPKLVQISAGDAVSPQHPTPGTGASTQGVVKISTDGSRVYFVATGRLTADATAGSNNLYVYRRDAAHPAGELEFLATFGSESSELWTLSAAPVVAVPVHGDSGDDGQWGDGRMLIFATPEKLVPEDTDSQADAYRIDTEATSDRIDCLSCVGNGEFPVEARAMSSYDTPFWNQPQIASDDGKVVVFWTKEGLVPDDTNGALDVYAWEDGDLTLVTPKAVPDARPNPAAGTTGDGSVIFLYTAASHVPSDQNSANDVYAARTGGGFPSPEATFITCLSGDECKAPAAAVPAAAAPGSASFVGPDNPPQREDAKCRKNQVRKGGKCVKKPPAKCKKNRVRKGGKCVKKQAKKNAGRSAAKGQKGGRG